MLQARHRGLGARSVRFSAAATLFVALISAGRVARAACFDCTSYDLNTVPISGDNGDDSAFGSGALMFNTSGGSNTAIGAAALEDNSTGDNNTATGDFALRLNATGISNTATGGGALGQNISGNDNVATGDSALGLNTTGSDNIAVGPVAGVNLTTGSNNIDIGNNGVAGESNTIRIGGVITSDEGTFGPQTATYVAGIYHTALPLSPTLRAVFIDSSGQLGTGFGGLISSARYKRDIRDMGDASKGLLKLRPVSFRYKQDPAGTLQYGLVAEEVERVYPELVVHGNDGKVEGVRYELLPALLLNEMQKQAKEKDAQIAALRRQVASQEKQIDALKKKDAQIDALAERMNAFERQVRLAKPEHLASAMR